MTRKEQGSQRAERAYLCLVLHAHLPFVRHPEFERFLEEDWLFEAILETYLPLLGVFHRLQRFGAPFRVTISLSPTLTAMLSDPVLQDRFLRHVDRLIELSEKEIERTRDEPEFHSLASRYLDHFRNSRRAFVDDHQRDLVGAFRRLQDAGCLEIMTCGATHGFLPLMLGNRNLWRGQILSAADDHERRFGRRPRGIWLPECAYAPGLEEIMHEAGIQYFFLETHGILHSKPRPLYGVYAPIMTPAGVVALGRDQQSSQQVWSSKVGYPGAPEYREFYRDIGFDLDFDYIRPYLHSDGHRSNTGIKYYRVTGDTDEKKPYDFLAAEKKADADAQDFLERRSKQADSLYRRFLRQCLIVSPFDAELFGHWWFEGPMWLDYLLRKMAYDQKQVKAITVPEYLQLYPNVQTATPSMSSWGHNGFCEYWLDKSNDWIYPHLQMAGERMIELANRFRDARGLRQRALTQAAREFLLAQSSDWAFIMKTGTVTKYATWRLETHIKNFNRLHREIESNRIDPVWLAQKEKTHCILPGLDYRVFADPE